MHCTQWPLARSIQELKAWPLHFWKMLFLHTLFYKLQKSAAKKQVWWFVVQITPHWPNRGVVRALFCLWLGSKCVTSLLCIRYISLHATINTNGALLTLPNHLHWHVLEIFQAFAILSVSNSASWSSAQAAFPLIYATVWVTIGCVPWVLSFPEATKRVISVIISLEVLSQEFLLWW